MTANEVSSSRAPEPALSRRVLVVEDNADAGELLGAFLLRAGHLARVACCAREALTIAAALRPEIALIDIGLPDMNGYELVRSLRALPGLEHCRYVAVTGHKSQSAIARSISAGFEAYLTKPVNPEDLLPLIRGDA
ncbi:MAG: response regulator [Polyangiaceae bacterium]